MNVLVVIPARFQSSRFPGKPLADLGGRPVLEHVYRRCTRAIDAEQVIIATDDERIAETARRFGARVSMTSTTCATGTDRVAEVAEQHDADWYVNVQGDEPFVLPETIAKVVEAANQADASVAAINAMSVIADEASFRSTTVPKVVAAPNGRLLYISRAPIPTDKSHQFAGAMRQVGLYAFRPDALRDFAAQPTKTPLEQVEDIEILRLLELGHTVTMIEVEEGGLAVDTPEDLDRAREYLAQMESR